MVYGLGVKANGVEAEGRLLFNWLRLTLFLLPFAKVAGSVEIVIITFNPYTLGMVALAGFGVLIFFLPDSPYEITGIDGFMGLFCLTYLVSTLLSDQLIGSGRLAFHAIFIPVVSYFAIKTLVTSEEKYRMALVCLVAGIALFAVAGFAHAGIGATRRYYLGRHPIGYATLAVTALCVLIYGGWWRRPAGLAGGLVSFLLLFSSLSRMYILGFLISPIIWVVIRKGGALLIYLGVFPISLGLTLFLALNPSVFKTHVDPEKEHEQQSLSRLTDFQQMRLALFHRAQAYEESYERFKEAPVFGHGLRIGGLNVTTHSFHMEWLEGGGIYGYVICSLLFFSYYARHAGPAREDRFCAVHLCAVTLVFFNSLTNGVMHGMMPYIIFIQIGFGEARRSCIAHRFS